jgi:hypothetical protein
MRRITISCRRRSRAVGRAGLKTRGLLIAAAINADSGVDSSAAALRK